MNTTTFPDELFDFAYFHERDTAMADLAAAAEKEDWDYQNNENAFVRPVLFNYIKYTYKRIAEESKIAMSSDGQFACFNTGLVTENQEPLFAFFEPNRHQGQQPWFFRAWLRKGKWELNRFEELPEMAHYFDDPTLLVFDVRKELRTNIEHIVEDNKERFPLPFREMENYGLQAFLKGAIDNARERVRRSYKTAIPQYYSGKIQLLLPLCITSPQWADLALVVERHPGFYRASTCLTLDMAYNNARQITKPDRDWLQP